MSNQMFVSKVQQLYPRLKNQQINHFELLGLLKTATHKEIESAYRQNIAEFSTENINMIANPEIKSQALFIAEKIHNAYETLINYDKRAAYEKRGFKDASPEDEAEDAPLEKAKSIYSKAKTLYSHKEYRKVSAVMQEAIKLDPDRPDYYLLLGKAQTAIPEQKRQAETNLNKALEMEPWNVEPHAALGLLFYSAKLYKRAETYFRKALSIEPDHALSRKYMAELVGPEKSFKDSLMKGLKKTFPSVFKKKK